MVSYQETEHTKENHDKKLCSLSIEEPFFQGATIASHEEQMEQKIEPKVPQK
jgi:hypothetical protein